MKYIIFLCFSAFTACSVNKKKPSFGTFTNCSVNQKYPNDDINASINMNYYTFPDDTKFLYKNKLYSKKKFEKKYDIMSFKKIEIIQDKKAVYELTKDSNCKAILKILY